MVGPARGPAPRARPPGPPALGPADRAAPDAALPVLDQLYADTHLYVRTSVANHLNDIAASQPDLVLATLQRWKESGRLSDGHFAFIARGALRNTLKEGWPPAHGVLGYAHDAPIDLTPLTLERTELRDGDTPARVRYLANVRSNGDQRMLSVLRWHTVPGRKRGLAVDVLGPVIAVVVPAASVHDNTFGTALLDKVAASAFVPLTSLMGAVPARADEQEE